ncbi:sensor domain-containing diguanylate cyclase [Sulfuritalea hydrogenivorans]|uniref:Diguanylate cyclase n=1 Tax=Sulfuritalea hydrogenivorans sk43H TaxID=1223802 RepID=W0SIG5_9PROT|nr:PAS-domain containing protein [Sulfuritalea hydrogenivorans]MDK9714352.1 PAS-domain containing protein [Sulfuritalea sp.]BAO30740.1 diguanylate cyclase [Sulfuritalea hydrogenivorans sk43H]
MNQPGIGYQDTLQTIINFLPSGITMFNADQQMVVCNRIFRTMLEFPDSLFDDGLPTLRELALFNAGRGEYGEGDPQVIADQVCERARGMQPHVFERQRPNGAVLEIRGAPLPSGGWVSIYTDITDRKRAEQEAQRYSTYLDTVLNSLPQGVTVVNEKLGVELWNKRFENLLNLPEGVLYPGVPFEEVIRKNAERGEYGDVDPVQKARDTVALAMKFEPHRLERTRADGRTLEIEGRDMQIDGKVAGFVTTYTDITDRIRNEEALRRVKNMMSDAINFSPTYIWETDAEGNYTHLQGVEHILGFAEQNLLGLPRAAMLHAGSDTSGEVAQRMKAREPVERLVVEARHMSGATVWLSTSARPVFDPSGRYMGYRGVDVDVTEITLARQELEQIALHDTLTGLANRRKFQDRYELERLRQARLGLPLTLILVDVDHFKQVNDVWGHIVGDICLKAVANLLASHLRPIDLVARFGGEEFLVLLSDANAAEGAMVAEKLRRALEGKSIDTGLEAQPSLQITASFGVTTLLPSENIALEAVIERADGAVYAAKRGGRNRVCIAEGG